jgi:hypothetical protein
LIRGDSGVVDQDIEMAKGAVDCLGHAVRVRVVAYIGLHQDGLAAQSLIVMQALFLWHARGASTFTWRINIGEFLLK